MPFDQVILATLPDNLP